MTLALSISNFENNFENFIVETETDVQAFIASVQKGAAFLESQLSSALAWVAKEVPTIVPIIEQALNFAATVGAASNPEAAIVITAAQEAVAALNAVAQAQGSGASNIQTLLAGYAAVKTAQASASSVAAAATNSVVAPATVAS